MGTSLPYIVLDHISLPTCQSIFVFNLSHNVHQKTATVTQALSFDGTYETSIAKSGTSSIYHGNHCDTYSITNDH